MIDRSIFIFVCSIGALIITVNSKNVQYRTRAPDAIGFPEDEDNINLMNKENRKPVYSPTICPENELFYPGDQKDDWICDCRPAHIYQPKTDKCWPAYRQGPCLEGQYLILPQKSVIPVCVANPCGTDSQVPWKGGCATMGLMAPCAQVHPSAAVGVNSTTLTIGCVRLNLSLRINIVGDTTESPNGLPGSKKSIKGKV